MLNALIVQGMVASPEMDVKYYPTFGVFLKLRQLIQVCIKVLIWFK